MFLSKSTYKKFPSWGKKYPNGTVSLNKIKFDRSWKPMMKLLFNDPKFEITEKELTKVLEDDSNAIVHPAPDLLFNAFKLTSLNKVKVVIIGQDPYFKNESGVHQAMGLSFSVALGLQVPDSLHNIYKNLIKFKHIKQIPTHGNLEFWALQGCLMLNTSLTVIDGSNNKNCHQAIWKWFTDKVIRYISENVDHVVFVLWGAHAIEKMNLIDLDKHEISASSHPSGFSVNNTVKSYQAFADCDHFGKVNQCLREWDIDEICWHP